MKTIKIKKILIELINGEEVPRKIKWEDKVYKYSNNNNNYLASLYSEVKTDNGLRLDYRPILEAEVQILEEDILTDKEREYLSAVIRPFRDRVEFIKKVCSFGDEYYIEVSLINCECFELPYFKGNTMYENMEADKDYTLEDLDL